MVCMDVTLVSNCNQIIMRLGEEIVVMDNVGHVSNGMCYLRLRIIIQKKHVPKNQSNFDKPLSHLT